MRKRTMVSVDEDQLALIRPMLILDDLSFSSWVRKCMREYLEGHSLTKSVFSIEDLK